MSFNIPLFKEVDMAGVGKFCLNCGYAFHGQRTGKCPSCDQSALVKNDEFYQISPEDIRRFEKFDRQGGDIMTLMDNEHIELIQASPEKNWVTLSVLGAIVTFNKNLEIIYSGRNKDGYGVDDFPPKILAEAANQASARMQ